MDRKLSTAVMISPKRFMRIYVLSIALTLPACITPDNKLTNSDSTPRQKTTHIFQPTLDKFTSITKDSRIAKPPDQKHASFKPLSAADIIGQTKNILLRVLGRPSFQRRDQPAEIWRYHDEACVLDIYLYRPRNTGAENSPLVTFLEARMPQGPSAESRVCLNIIRRRFLEKTLS